MFGKEVMTTKEAFMISLTGLCIVFLTLIVISIMIKLTSVVVNSITKGDKEVTQKAPQQAAAPRVENKKDGAEVAAIIAAVSEEMKLPVDQFKILSIKEKN